MPYRNGSENPWVQTIRVEHLLPDVDSTDQCNTPGRIDIHPLCLLDADEDQGCEAGPLRIEVETENSCRAMSGSDGNPSPYELCVAQGMFSHSVYSIQFAGISLLRGTDDNTTKGIDGNLYGSPVRLQCAPVNHLADDVTNESMERTIQANRISPSGISFEDELKSAIMTNLIEIGRHCTLSKADDIVAKLDVVFPE